MRMVHGIVIICTYCAIYSIASDTRRGMMDTHHVEKDERYGVGENDFVLKQFAS